MARTARKSRSRRSRRTKACRGKRRSRARWSSKRCRTTSKRRGTRSRGKSRRRNPSGMERTLRDGTTLSLHEDGSYGVLYVHYPDGGMDDFRLPWKKAAAKFRAFKSGKKYSRRATKDDWAMVAADNPRRRKGRGRKTRRNCGMTKDPRWATTRIIRKGSKRNPRGRKTYHPRGRNKWTYSNPAQFPMPFVSAMNPRIRRSEARGMGRILRRHGYKRCRV